MKLILIKRLELKDSKKIEVLENRVVGVQSTNMGNFSSFILSLADFEKRMPNKKIDEIVSKGFEDYTDTETPRIFLIK